MNRSSLAGRDVVVRVPKAAELVAESIRRSIITGQLRGDDLLPSEATLMDEFGVSRPTLREAVRILESEGLVVVRRGAHGGARVREPSVDAVARNAGLVLQHRNTTLADVLRVRVAVEAPAAGMLAGRKDRADVAMSLRTRLAEPDADAPLHFHEFNTLVVELTESPTLVLLTTMLEHISSRATLNFVRHTGEGQNGPLARRAHRGRERLVALVAAGDAPGAEAHWRIHLTEAGERLVAGAGDSVLALFD